MKSDSEKQPVLSDSWNKAAKWANFATEQVVPLREFLTGAKKLHEGSRLKTVMARPGPLAEGPQYLVALTFLFVVYSKNNVCQDKQREVKKALIDLKPYLAEQFQTAEVFTWVERKPNVIRQELQPFEPMHSR